MNSADVSPFIFLTKRIKNEEEMIKLMSSKTSKTWERLMGMESNTLLPRKENVQLSLLSLTHHRPAINLF